MKSTRKIFYNHKTAQSKEKWETVIDFTKIKKGGIDAKELLKYL